MNLNSKLAREILKNAEEHRLAAPRYVTDTGENPASDTYGEFHLFGPEAPSVSLAYLLISKTPPRRNYIPGPPFYPDALGMFYVPAGTGIDVPRRVLIETLEAFPDAPFIARHYGNSGKRAWRLFFRTTDECKRIATAINCRHMGRNAWFYADAKYRIESTMKHAMP